MSNGLIERLRQAARYGVSVPDTAVEAADLIEELVAALEKYIYYIDSSPYPPRGGNKYCLSCGVEESETHKPQCILAKVRKP